MNRVDSGEIQILAPFGQITTLLLNDDGWLKEIRDPGGRTHTMTYVNELGLIQSFKKPSGEVSTFNYDSQGLLTYDSSTSGAFWDLLYEIGQNQSSIEMTSAEGRKSKFAIDTSEPGFTRTVTSPAGATQTHIYKPGVSSEKTSPEGLHTLTSFAPDDRFGTMSALNATSVSTTPGGDSSAAAESRTSVADSQNILSLISQPENLTVDSNVYQTTYSDSAYHTRSPEGRTFSIALNSQDQLVRAQVGSQLPVLFAYDPHGRLQSLQQGPRQTLLSYDEKGYVDWIQNALNQKVHFLYDNHGQVTNQILPDGREISYAYDANGNLASITPPSRRPHTLAYNLFDLVASYVAPAIGSNPTVTAFSYNRDKQIVKIQRPDGTEVRFNYAQVSGQLKSIVAEEGTYPRELNAANQLTELRSPNDANLFWTYDATLAKSQRLVTPAFTADVLYEHANFVPKTEKIVDHSGAEHVLPLEYDRDLLISKVGNLVLTRDPANVQITKTKLGFVEEKMEYEPGFGEPKSYTAFFKGKEIYSETYTRDALGRIITKSIREGKGKAKRFSYTFDSSGRLTQVALNSRVMRKYFYDQNSNRTSVQDGKKIITATYDEQDRLLRYGNKTYQYNDLGVRTISTSIHGKRSLTLTYDSLGALKQAIKRPGKKVIYNYLNDGLGQRIEKRADHSVSQRYIYDVQGRLIAELDSTGKLKSRFVYATRAHSPDYMIQNGVEFKFLHDQLGSVRQVVNVNTGKVIAMISYDEFGVVEKSRNISFQPFGFAGGIYDPDTGLVRFGARDYDPETGRWTSKDPILFAGGDTNLYSYVLQDPVNFIDPGGDRFRPPIRPPWVPPGNRPMPPGPRPPRPPIIPAGQNPPPGQGDTARQWRDLFCMMNPTACGNFPPAWSPPPSAAPDKCTGDNPTGAPPRISPTIGPAE